MNRKGFQGKTSLALMREFVDKTRALVKYQDAGPEEQLRWLHKRWLIRKKHKLRAALAEIMVELANRYEGVFFQMLRKSGKRDEELRNSVAAIWIESQDRSRTLQDYKGFPAILWEAYASQVSRPATLVKPKFMLRIFVDEMAPSDARGILKDRAYDKNAINKETGNEMLEQLSGGYSALHEQLLRRASDLEVLTDGEIALSLVQNLKEPFLQYERWLFPNE
jgi:hypothetical protein